MTIKPLPKNLKRTKLITSIAAVSVIALSAFKADQLSKEPDGEKNCPVPAMLTTSELDSNILYKSSDLIDSLEGKLSWKQKGGYINDISCLDQTGVYGVIKIENEEDIKSAINYAREKKLKISMAGARHSMGGQAFYKNNLVLDMIGYKHMSLNKEEKILTVESGATWHDIQNFLHPEFAVKSMQSTDIFTVGGSVSVNAHGMDHLSGSVGSSIKSMRIMRPDGKVEEISPTKNPKLFNLVVGGYGLFGVVLNVDLEVVSNDIYKTERQIVDYKKFPEIFESEILPNKNLGLFYGHLSTSSSSLLKEMILYKYTKADVQADKVPLLEEVSNIRLRRFIFNFSKLGKVPMDIKWFMEKRIEPKLETCSITPRTEAMSQGEACFVSRNEPMHDSVKYTKNDNKKETDILHEYFIPRENFVAFIDGLREVIIKDKVNLLNASVRVIHPEKNTLNYAPTEMYSIVLYINQQTTPEGNEKMEKVTRELIDLTTSLDGRFFLPYQLHYSAEQLKNSYPNIKEFFDSKKMYDTDELFTNTFYEKYGKSIT